MHNNIVTDHSACTCIDKKNDYDLLNPVTLPPPKRTKPRLKEQLKQVKADRRLLLAELKYVLSQRLKHLVFEELKPLDIVGAINTCVEILTHRGQSERRIP